MRIQLKSSELSFSANDRFFFVIFFRIFTSTISTSLSTIWQR